MLKETQEIFDFVSRKQAEIEKRYPSGSDVHLTEEEIGEVMAINFKIALNGMAQFYCMIRMIQKKKLALKNLGKGLKQLAEILLDMTKKYEVKRDKELGGDES